MGYLFDNFKTQYQRKMFGELSAVADTVPAEGADDEAIMDYAVRLYDKFGLCRGPFMSLPQALDEPRADLRRQYERLVQAGSPLQYLLCGILVDGRDSIIAAPERGGVRMTRIEALQEAERHEAELPERWRHELWYRLGLAYSYGDDGRSAKRSQEYFEKGLAAGDERCREHLSRLTAKYGTDSSGRVREPLGQRMRNALSLKVPESEVRSSSYGVFRLSCLVAGLAVAAYLCYDLLTSGYDWQSLVNWNMMTSPLSSVLALVVWVMYLPHWVSFELKSYWVDDETGKKTRNRDVVDNVYEWIFPIAANLVLIPFMITVALFYVIMGLFSVVAAVMPFVAAIVAAVVSIYIYRVSGKLRAYKVRKAVTMLLMAVYVAVAVWITTLV